MTTRRLTLVRLLLLAGLAATALTGCSTDRLGAAAVVDGEAIRTQTLQDAAAQRVAGGSAENQRGAALEVLQSLIVSRVFDRLSERLDVTVSSARVAEELRIYTKRAGSRAELAAAARVAPSQLEDWARDRMIFTKIATRGEQDGLVAQLTPQQEARAQQLIVRAARRMDIEVNPRYGEWDPRSGLQPLVSGGLAADAEPAS